MTSWQPTSRTAWWRFFLAAVAAVLGTLLSATTASAATPTTAQTRVGAITVTTPAVVGFDTGVWASQYQVHGPPQAGIVSATGVATKAAPEVGAASNKIYSSRVLERMAEESGPYHNFPGSFDEAVFSQGNRSVVPDYFKQAKPNLGSDSIQYRLPGSVNGRAGTYEIFTRPSLSGRTELITHRFFRPDY